jgi:predicted transcriptional regulator
MNLNLTGDWSSDVCSSDLTKADGLARTGVADLAKRAKCDRSTVIRAVRLLVEKGRLEVVRRGGIGRGPSTYRVK